MSKKKIDKARQKRLAKQNAARARKASGAGNPSMPMLRPVNGDASDDIPFPMPDPRAMEAQLRGMFGVQENTPAAQAQELMSEAFDKMSGPERVALAHQALEVSPDCADAWVLLAEEEATTAEEAIELLRKGVSAGERLIGPEAFEENAGEFWGVLETRPYMRARANLAQYLWATGEEGGTREAVGHYRELVRLDSRDHQGHREILLVLLVEIGEDEEAAQLIESHPGVGTACWLYSNALLAFRRGGDCDGAREALADALDQNPHVPGFLLGETTMPDEPPMNMGYGDENEAVHYVAGAMAGWDETQEALSWLEAQAALPTVDA
ncbi:MAG: hypothetical protein DRJ42_11670 [Deltaproteobacteria bacterium]|nr:MAG: hypothetical protein DRJ42_11670 [Deltaproteobacteria bacterium]